MCVINLHVDIRGWGKHQVHVSSANISLQLE